MFCNKCGNELPNDSKFCPSCGDKIEAEKTFKKEIKKTEPAKIEKTETYEQNLDIEYYSISIGKLILFTILTVGLYELFWFYKQWDLIKSAEKIKISPLGRTIFAVFYCGDLFKRVLKSAEKQGYTEKYSPTSMSMIYIISIIAGNVIARAEVSDIASVITVNIIWLALTYLSIYPLVKVQKAINFNNSKIVKDFDVNKKSHIGEIIFVILGTIFFLFIVAGITLPFIPVNNNSSGFDLTKGTAVWQEFKSEADNFEVLMPSKPKSETHNYAEVSATLYTAELDNGNAFIVGASKYSDNIDTSNPEDNLRGSINGMLLDDKNRKIINSEYNDFEGYRSVDFLLQIDGRVFTKGKNIMVGKRIYSLMYAYENNNYSDQDYNKFINSFKLDDLKKESSLDEKLKCKEIGDKYVNDFKKELAEFDQEIGWITVDYTPKLDTCLIMYSIYNMTYYANGTYKQDFAFNTIHDLLGGYDSTCLLGGNDPISEQTEAKFHYLLTGEKLPELTTEYIRNIKNFCNISF